MVPGPSFKSVKEPPEISFQEDLVWPGVESSNNAGFESRSKSSFGHGLTVPGRSGLAYHCPGEVLPSEKEKRKKWGGGVKEREKRRVGGEM